MTRVGWPAVLLAAFLVAGCGDVMGSTKPPPPKPMSRAQFVHAANRACARADRQLRNVRFSKNFFRAKAQARNIFVPTYERLLFELRRLTPPRANAADFQRLLATFNDEDLVVHRFLDAADALQVRRVKTLSKKLDFLSKRLDSRAAKLGLRSCAKG